MRIWAIAILSLVIQGIFAAVGFLVGLVAVGLYMGYTRAWAIAAPPVARAVEDEDG